ncbi:MAG: WG repeat-containing protein [Lacibacter sp.]
MPPVKFLFPHSKVINDTLILWGYIDTTGKWLIEPAFNVAYDFRKNHAIVFVKGKGKGVIDTQGKFVIEPVYHDIEHLNDTIIKLIDGNKHITLAYTNGKQLSNRLFNRVGTLSEGWINVAVLDSAMGFEKWGFISPYTGKEIDFRYSMAGYFSEGLALVEVDGSKWGFIDTNGKQVIPAQYDDVGIFYRGMAPVKIKENNWGFVNRSNVIAVIPNLVEKISLRPQQPVYLFQDAENSLYGFVNNDGDVVVAPQYEEAEIFSEGRALVKSDDKAGFIDTTGKTVVALQYDDARSFNNGFAAVTPDGEKWFFIDKNGKQLGKLVFEEVEDFNEAQLASVKQNGKWGILKSDGTLLLPCVYDLITTVTREPFVTFLAKKGTAVGMVLPSGKEFLTEWPKSIFKEESD